MITWLRAHAVMIGVAVLVVWLIAANIEIVRLSTANQTLNDRVVALRSANAICTANVAGLRIAVDNQNKAVDALASDTRARLEATQTTLNGIAAGSKALDARVKRVLAPLTGQTACDRMIEADARLLEGLK